MYLGLAILGKHTSVGFDEILTFPQYKIRLFWL